MPSDIRSFFGGPPSGPPAAKPKPAEPEKPKKRGRTKKVVSDDEDDAPVATKSTPSKKKKALSPPPALEEMSAGDFFGKDNKPKKTEAVRPKANGKPAGEVASKPAQSATSTPKKSAKQSTASSSRSSARKAKNSTSYVELDEDDFPDDDLDADDNFKAEAMVGRRAGDDYKEGSVPDDKPLVPVKGKSGKQRKLKAEDDDAFEPDQDVDMKDVNDDDDFVVPDDDEKIVKSKPAKSNGHKRKSSTLDDDDDDLEVEEARPVKKRAAPAKKATPATKGKPAEQQTSAAMKAIFDSIPTVEAPPPPPKSGDGDGKPKFQFGAHANSAVPAGAIDESEIPTGADNCLAGLTFVFTGQLQRIGREQGQNLVKRYGGKITSGPSSKTSYVVLGEDAGPKKLQVIQQFKLATINEDGLFELIRRLPANGGDSAAAEKNAEKRAKEEDEIRKAAAEMEKQERAQLTASKPKPQAVAQAAGQSAAQAGAQGKGKQSVAGPDTRLWTVRYAPQQSSQICGNKGQVDKLARWLRLFSKSQKAKFKMPGPDGSGTFRAVMIHGPPGIGKTTAAHLIAKLEGYDIVESNASDTRSKKLVETGLKGVLSTTSLMGYFGTGGGEVEASKKKLVLIMDEVDGMSAGDRGGVGALAAVCKKTQIPMILICNDRRQQKMRPFDSVTYDLPFRRPTVDQIRSRMMTIAYREGLKIPPNVVNALIEGSGADIRQVVNMISTAKLDAKDLSYEDGKDMSKAWEKHIVLKPWDMVSKILGGGLFNPASKSTLNDKQELYFNDHEFAPLMLQENYLGTNPQRTNRYNANPRMKHLAQLDLVSKAADAISDGDLVDRMIHGSQQQWSLMPAHAMFSFVRPASYVYGTQAGNQTRFTSWLGKNSNQGKLMRIVKEIQGHMRLRVSADRHEIRQTYLPLLFDRLVWRLQSGGKEIVPEVIKLMDEYFLTKEDWDGILELGVGNNDMEGVKIETQTKATFTRLYNQQSHPLPFMKASQVVAPKGGAAKEKPDLEEAIEESDDELVPADDPEAETKEDDNDLSKDKYVKQPKKKAAAGKGASASKKRKAGADDGNESEGEKPKKGKGKAKAKK